MRKGRGDFLRLFLGREEILPNRLWCTLDGYLPGDPYHATIENGKAYVISGSGEIVCLDTADGKIVWKVDGGKKFERMTGKWGTSECPLVFDNKVIYTPGGNQTTMVALDAETGETVWKSEPLGEHRFPYTSPLLVMNNGKIKIVGVTGKSVFGVNPETGKIEWTFRDSGTVSGRSGERI